RALLAAGGKVRVLARPGGDRRNLAGLDVEIAEGRLEDPASLAAAVAGCETVYHVAADYRLWVPDPAAMFRANVDGTVALMQAAFAAEAAVRELVAARGLPAVIVNPSTPVGPGDIRPTPTGRLIVEAARGRMP